MQNKQIKTNLSILNNQQVMSSKEIAELTGKEHNHIMRDIRKIEEELGASISGQSSYKTEQNKELPMLLLDKENSLLLVSGYSVVLRQKIIKRWQELENQVKQEQDRLTARHQGKITRRLETNEIKSFVEYAKNQGSKSPDKYYIHITNMTNTILGIASGERDKLTGHQLRQVDMLESVVRATLPHLMEANIPYKDVFQSLKHKCKDIIDIIQVKLN